MAVATYDDGKDVAACLLDRRLAKTKGRRITSFFSGGVLPFLCATPLFPDSVVLASVLPTTLEAFTSLVSDALGSARRFKLMFRSSRDGATSAAFHSRCDAQGPTLTLVKDADGNVFGGYVAKQWSSPAYPSYHMYPEDSTTFLFTVVNPHSDPPALFPSIACKYAICCQVETGPHFVEGLYLGRNYDGGCSSSLGHSYKNTTRHRGDKVFTGALYFRPVEVEVWGLV